MAIEQDSKTFEEFKELTSAVSTQAQVSNRYWLGLMTVAVVSLLPVTPSNAGVPLPFGLHSVPTASYYLVLYVMLIVLTIAFSTGHAQQVRAQILAQSFIDRLPHGYEFGHANPRDLYDNLRLPSFNRVAPLAQLLRGKYQFYGGEAPCPRHRRIASTIYYVLLKIVSLVVYFGVPAIALCHTFWKTPVTPSVYRFALGAGGTIALFTLGQILYTDAKYSIGAIRRMWSLKAKEAGSA